MRIKTDSRTKVLCPHDVASIFQCILKAESVEDQDKEHLWVVGLNTRNVIKYIEMVYLGSMNQSPVSAREVFRLAISEGTAAIIICHNHPSGDAEPSTEDCSTTEHLIKGGNDCFHKVCLIDYLRIHPEDRDKIISKYD